MRDRLPPLLRRLLSRAWPVATVAVLVALVAPLAVLGDGGGAATASTVTTSDASTSAGGDAPGPATASPTGDPSDSPSTSTSTSTSASVPSRSFEVDDAELRWGLNNESNNRAFAPGTFNFFSAGKIPNPGRGGQTMPQSAWKQADGNVSIQKYSTAAGGYVPATWAGLQTDSDGNIIASPTSGRFSNHQVVIDHGVGTVDPATGTATISWTGSFTVVYYSGYGFFYVTDPTLTVTHGDAVLTATLGGYASSMDDLSKWQALPDTPATLADLGQVDLGAGLGFTATPAYAGVAVTIPAGGAPQRTDLPGWGSFPQSFIDFQVAGGLGSYWYTSGGSTDGNKPALPLTVSYDAGNPITQAAPSTDAAVPDPIVNKIRKPPHPSGSPTPSSTPASSTPAGSADGTGTPAGSDLAPPPDNQAPVAAAGQRGAIPMSTILPLADHPPADTGIGGTDARAVAAWSAGSLALVLAGVIVLGTLRPAVFAALRRAPRPGRSG
jgi:hypothetical protein